MRDFGIDPAVWRRLNQLLDEALDLPPELRADWLASLPPEAEALKPRLTGLLSHSGAGSTFRTLPKFLEDFQTEREGGSRVSGEGGAPGEVVGAYRLSKLLGEGGMGTVWLAERTDGMLQRPVALKLPRGVFSRPELAGRLAREREILASLNHPNIAKVYDAGLTAGGQPFLALELVEGSLIDEYVRTTRADLRTRLRLFLQVARAVAYAHSRLVVHRDIKPSNILVTADGSVRLLDFGVAKLLEDGQAMETEITRVSGRAMTLAYAAPEQLSGGPIGVGTDLYSLGVVLFELLTGSRPYNPENDSREALENAILHQLPPRPSTVAEDEGFSARLRGDLDTILLKTLKKDPAERYATVDAFVDDIERYLDGRPVLAQPDTISYRLRKFVGRNRLLVAAAVVVLVAVLAGAGLAFWQARVAVAEKARAEDVKEFILSVFKDANPYIGGEKAFTAVDLLRNAEERIDAGFQEGSETRVELFTIVGSSLNELQDYAAASRVLERAVSEATESLGPTHPRTLHARMARVNNYRFFGKTEEMKKELASILPELDRPSSDLADRIDAIENTAHLAVDEGRFADAERAADRAFGLAMAAHGEKSAITAAMARLQAMTYDYANNERTAEVTANAYRINLEYYNGNQRHPSVVDVRVSHGLSLIDQGRLAEGVAHLAATVDDARALFGDSSAMVGFFSGHLYRAQLEIGDIPGALANAETNFRILTGLAEPDSYTYAAAFANTAEALLAARRPEEALARLNEAIPKLERVLEPSHEVLTKARLNRALALADAGDTDSADAELDALEHIFHAKDPPLYRWLYAKGTVARLAGDYERALSHQQAALVAVPEGPRSETRKILPLVELGLDRLELGDANEAEKYFQEALGLMETNQSKSSPRRADALVGLARVYLGRQQAPRALPLVEEAETYWREITPECRAAADAAHWREEVLKALARTARSTP